MIHHSWCSPNFIIFLNQMLKLLKDANFLSVYVYLYMCMHMICLQASWGRCAQTEPSSYGWCETKNKQCSSSILTTKGITTTNYYDTMMILKELKVTRKSLLVETEGQFDNATKKQRANICDKSWFSIICATHKRLY